MSSEDELIMKAKNGDEDSFEALILSCKGKAYSIAYRCMQNEEDALDAMEESFIKIYRHLAKFNGKSRFDTWVYRIVVNTCNDMLRKSRKYNSSDSVYKNDDGSEVVIEVADSGPGPSELAEMKEERAYISECLNRLVIEHREVLILRDIKGFAYDEIAEILDCSIGTVKSKISRARRKLKEIYFSGIEKQEQILN